MDGAGNAPWLSIAAGANGSGNGTVQVAMEVNGAGPRTGTATIAGKAFTVNQGSGCSFTINPAAQTVPAAGGSVTVSVGGAASCAWTAASNAPWLTVVSGANGSGPGAVQVDAQANTGAPRNGTVTIAGQTLTVSQDSGCTFTVSPETIAAPAAAGRPHIDVSGAPSCAWNAVVVPPGWITIVSAPAGNGNGGIDVTTAANSGPARSGTLLVAGRTVTINQDSGCTITLGAASTTVPAGGGPGSRFGIVSGRVHLDCGQQRAVDCGDGRLARIGRRQRELQRPGKYDRRAALGDDHHRRRRVHCQSAVTAFRLKSPRLRLPAEAEAVLCGFRLSPEETPKS